MEMKYEEKTWVVVDSRKIERECCLKVDEKKIIH